MNKRGAYFFVIDALIAGSIIFLSLVLIFSSHSIRPESTPTLRIVEDYSKFMLETRVREYQGTYIRGLINDSNITNLDNTLAEQLIEFYYRNETKPQDLTYMMDRYIGETLKGFIPTQRSVEISIDNTLLCQRVRNPQKNSKLVLNSKKIGFIQINESYIYGPVTFEVKVWV